MKGPRIRIVLAALALAAGAVRPASAAPAWAGALQQDADWYGSAEAKAMADSVLLYQTESGGWPKNWDLGKPPGDAFRALSEDARAPTIDNGATTTPIRFLAMAFGRSPDPRYRAAAEKGIDYLLAAQYPNGGWPQFFPLRKGYATHITFNDDAMIRALETLRDAAKGAAPFGWVDPARRERAAGAVKRGIACILRCQIVTDGVKTAWCAQHDEMTFAPAAARRFEPASLTAGESVGIVNFLMREPDPSPEVAEAVHAAVAWLRKVQLNGIRWERVSAPDKPGGRDAIVVEDPSAGPLWARFYEIGTNRPIFIGRDAVIRYDVREIEHERRVGYAWYVTRARALLERDYPRWSGRARP